VTDPAHPAGRPDRLDSTETETRKILPSVRVSLRIHVSSNPRRRRRHIIVAVVKSFRFVRRRRRSILDSRSTGALTYATDRQTDGEPTDRPNDRAAGASVSPPLPRAVIAFSIVVAGSSQTLTAAEAAVSREKK